MNTTVELVFSSATECWVLLNGERRAVTLDGTRNFGQKQWALDAAAKHGLPVIDPNGRDPVNNELNY